MTVIDKILNEWSFRCHDGIVDIRNPKKLSVLKEILVEYKILTEDIDDDILNALSRLDPNDPRKEKVLTYLAGGDDEKDKEIEKLKQQIGGSKQEKQVIIKKLTDKNIPEKVSRFIVFEASESEELENLGQLIDSLEKLEKEWEQARESYDQENATVESVDEILKLSVEKIKVLSEIYLLGKYEA